MNTQTSLNHLNYEYSNQFKPPPQWILKPVKTTSTMNTQTSLNHLNYEYSNQFKPPPQWILKPV